MSLVGGYDHLHSILKPYALRYCFIYVKVRHIYNYLSSVYNYDDQTLVFMHVEMTSYLQIIHGLCPGCLSSLLQQYHPQRSLLSTSKLLFTVRTVNSVTYGKRAFSFSAPILWNSLQSFKSAIKTFLFRKFYF